MDRNDESGYREQDAGSGEDPADDPGEELEALIMQADRPFASGSFGTTAREQEEGESLDQRLAEERPVKRTVEDVVVVEDADGPDDEAELVGEASLEHDPFVAPEEAAMTVRDEAPGGVDHPADDRAGVDGSEET